MFSYCFHQQVNPHTKAYEKHNAKHKFRQTHSQLPHMITNDIKNLDVKNIAAPKVELKYKSSLQPICLSRRHEVRVAIINKQMASPAKKQSIA